MDMKAFRNPISKFHPNYQLPLFPTFICTAVPPFAEGALLSKPATVLCHVRGFGDNFDAHNIVHPLILDNIIEVTGLTADDLFIIPTTIQAILPEPKDDLRILVEENVMTVMYNPATVLEHQYLDALESMGLADSTQTVKLSLRSIPLEYIAHPDTILDHPVPTHSLEPINCIMIPLAPKTCGIYFTNLLISAGVIACADLLHVTVLPLHPQERYEYGSPRLYLFLTRGVPFRDAYVLGNPTIKALLAPPILNRRRILKFTHLPGLRAIIQPEGTWSRNRQVLTGTPPAVLTKSNLVAIPSAGETCSEPTDVPSTISTTISTTDTTPTTLTTHNYQHLVQQQSKFNTTQDLLLESSRDMVRLLTEVSLSLKANALGSQGAAWGK
jgi:hypothetical protein